MPYLDIHTKENASGRRTSGARCICVNASTALKRIKRAREREGKRKAYRSYERVRGMKRGRITDASVRERKRNGKKGDTG